MDKEEILARSRKENKDQDEMVIDIYKKAGNAASRVGLLVSLILLAIETLVFRNFHFGFFGIYLSMEATKDLFIYTKLKDKKLLYIGVLGAIVAILDLVAYFAF